MADERAADAVLAGHVPRTLRHHEVDLDVEPAAQLGGADERLVEPELRPHGRHGLRQDAADLGGRLRLQQLEARGPEQPQRDRQQHQAGHQDEDRVDVPDDVADVGQRQRQSPADGEHQAQQRPRPPLGDLRGHELGVGARWVSQREIAYEQVIVISPYARTVPGSTSAPPAVMTATASTAA